MPTYGTLCRTHAEYDAELFEELELLYEGGYAILRDAKKILRRGSDEHPNLHEERCANASYIPYLGQIVDQLTSWLFTDEIQVQPAADAADPNTPGELPDEEFYGAFASDADRTGLSFADMLRAAVPRALLLRRALIGVDLPRIDPVEAETFRSAADERIAGADRAYLYDVPAEQLINWDKRDDGTLKWAVLRSKTQPQAGPLDPAETVVDEFRIWTLDGPEGTARWEVYRVEYPPGEPPQAKDDVPLVDGGETPFTRIPIIELELPKGLWVGNKIGPLCREHFRERSRLMSSEAKSLDEIPVIKQGPEIGGVGAAMPSDLQQNPNRGISAAQSWKQKGYTVLGAGDEFDFKGPSGIAFTLKNQQLGELKDEIFRVVHLMAASVSNNKSAALGRSGLAKQEDKADTAIVLTALGSYVLRFGIRLYDTVAQGRGDDVVWGAKGLSEYAAEDRATLIQEASQLDTVDIPSPTWKAAYKTEVALKLTPGLRPEEQATVRAEIKDGTEHENDLRALMRGAGAPGAGDDSRLPPGAPPPGVGVPGGKSPGDGSATASGAPAAPQPGGATADGKVSQNQAAKDAGTPAPGAVGAVGPSGQPLLPETAHHQDGRHIDSAVVYNLLADDYAAADIEWVRTVPWSGPVEAPLVTIDSSKMDRWQAAQPGKDADLVAAFAAKLKAGEQLKPVVLVNNPSTDQKLIVVDGHHRFLAYQQMGMPPVAYVGDVGSDDGPWSSLHDSKTGASQQK